MERYADALPNSMALILRNVGCNIIYRKLD